MELPIYNQSAESVGTIKVSDGVFNAPMNQDLLYQVVTAQAANQRQNIAHAKGRSEVRGGGKKPWQQKGTGRARHGSIRSPIWKGGGVTHGPSKERNFKQKINQKAAQRALSVALSAKVREGHAIVVDAITLDQPKTRIMVGVFKKLATALPTSTAKRISSLLLVLPFVKDDPLRRSTQNIPHVSVSPAGDLNARTVLSSKYLILLKDSVTALEKKLARS